MKTRPNCGGTMIGDGHTQVLHCEFAELPYPERHQPGKRAGLVLASASASAKPPAATPYPRRDSGLGCNGARLGPHCAGHRSVIVQALSRQYASHIDPRRNLGPSQT